MDNTDTANKINTSTIDNNTDNKKLIIILITLVSDFTNKLEEMKQLITTTVQNQLAEQLEKMIKPLIKEEVQLYMATLGNSPYADKMNINSNSPEQKPQTKSVNVQPKGQQKGSGLEDLFKAFASSMGK